MERGTGRVAGTLRVGPGAGPSAASYPGPRTYIPEGGRERLFANSLGFSAPHAESRRVPGGGAGGQGERERAQKVRGPENPRNSWSVIHPPDWAENNRLRLI